MAEADAQLYLSESEPNSPDAPLFGTKSKLRGIVAESDEYLNFIYNLEEEIGCFHMEIIRSEKSLRGLANEDKENTKNIQSLKREQASFQKELDKHIEAIQALKRESEKIQIAMDDHTEKLKQATSVIDRDVQDERQTTVEIVQNFLFRKTSSFVQSTMSMQLKEALGLPVNTNPGPSRSLSFRPSVVFRENRAEGTQIYRTDFENEYYLLVMSVSLVILMGRKRPHRIRYGTDIGITCDLLTCRIDGHRPLVSLFDLAVLTPEMRAVLGVSGHLNNFECRWPLTPRYPETVAQLLEQPNATRL